jgi:hypothetical protein
MTPPWPGYGYPAAVAPFVPPPPRPGCVPLRPLGLSDILDGSFTMIRRNPKLTLGLSAGVAGLQLLIMLAVEVLTSRAFGGVYVTSSANPSASTSLGPLLGGEATQLLQLVVTTLLGALLTGMLTVAITQDVLGVRVTLAQAWAQVRPRMWRLLILAVVTTVAEFAGLIFFIAPGVWLWGAWAVAVPALMVERTTMRGALRRSRQLVRGTFWRVWGIRALGVLIVEVLAGIIVIPFVIAGAVVDSGTLSSGTDHFPVLFAVLTALGSAVAAAFTAPVRAGIDALLYVDLRMRKEGLDIVLQQQLYATTPAPPPPPRTAF